MRQGQEVGEDTMWAKRKGEEKLKIKKRRKQKKRRKIFIKIIPTIMKYLWPSSGLGHSGGRA